MTLLVGLLLGLGMVSLLSPRRAVLPPERAKRSWSDRADELIRQSGVDAVQPAAVLGVSVVGAAVVCVLVLAISGVLAIAAAFAGFGAYAPWGLLRMRRRRRGLELREAWPEAVDNLASAIRAGLSLPEALSALGTAGPETLRGPFLRFAQDYRSSGRFGECLDRLKADLADPVGDRVVEALRTAREVGGSDLGRLLRTLAAFLREDARTRAEVEARQGVTVNGARLAAAAPWIVLLLLASNAQAAAAYRTPGGTVVLVVGLSVTVAAYRAMQRIARLPAEPRVLR